MPPDAKRMPCDRVGGRRRSNAKHATEPDYARRRRPGPVRHRGARRTRSAHCLAQVISACNRPAARNIRSQKTPAPPARPASGSQTTYDQPELEQACSSRALIAAAAVALLAAATMPVVRTAKPAVRAEARDAGLRRRGHDAPRAPGVHRQDARREDAEERIKLRDEHRAEMQKRAQEKGMTLQEPQRRGGQKGGAKGIARAGARKPSSSSPSRSAPTSASACTTRRRRKSATRSATKSARRPQARAKEKGITLPEPRGPRGPKPAPAPAPEAPKAQ